MKKAKISPFFLVNKSMAAALRAIEPYLVKITMAATYLISLTGVIIIGNATTLPAALFRR
jgi:hypothetical protein